MYIKLMIGTPKTHVNARCEHGQGFSTEGERYWSTHKTSEQCRDRLSSAHMQNDVALVTVFTLSWWGLQTVLFTFVDCLLIKWTLRVIGAIVCSAVWGDLYPGVHSRLHARTSWLSWRCLQHQRIARCKQRALGSIICHPDQITHSQTCQSH